MISFRSFGKDVVYTMEYMELFYGKTLSDTMRHNKTLCDGVCEGVFRVEIQRMNHEGDKQLKVQSIISPSYIL